MAVDERERLEVRLSVTYQGWVMKCPRCDMVRVRDNWTSAMAEAHWHLLVHRYNIPYSRPSVYADVDTPDTSSSSRTSTGR